MPAPDPLFLAAAATVIASPGPGLMFTLGNALRLGFVGALGGIVGIASGSALIAVAVAGGLGTLVSAHPQAMLALRVIGAAYLAWLGVKVWRSAAAPLVIAPGARHRAVALEGLTLQLSNPNAIMFFIAVMPQFIDFATADAALLGVTIAAYVLMVVVIHGGYAALAARAATLLATPAVLRRIDRTGGMVLIALGAILLVEAKGAVR